MAGPGQARLAALVADLGLGVDPARAAVEGRDPLLPCRYPLGESAAAVMAAIGLVSAAVGEDRGLGPQTVASDARHGAAHLRGFLDQTIDGETLDPDPTGHLAAVGLFATRDGWVQTYGAFPPLRGRTLEVLRCADDRVAIARAAAGWGTDELVAALDAAGAPAAAVATAAAWDASPQGRALAGLPVVAVERVGEAPPEPLPPLDGDGDRPLAGVRVLDLTRVLAGPVCGRTLAEHGADVLSVVAPRLHAVHRAIVDTSPGKRSAHLDLADRGDRATLDALLPQADVVAQNARPGVLARRGLGADDVAERRPGVVYVSVDAYGHEGPWRGRPGFEPLAQAATGWADAHRDAEGRPSIVPALPCDHLAGHLAALGAMHALRRRAREGGSWHVRVSLCRTATWLRDQPGGGLDPAAASGITAGSTTDLRDAVATPFGVVDHLRPGVRMSGTPPRWDRPGEPPGASPASFRDR